MFLPFGALSGSALNVVHYRKFQNYETVRGSCIPSKNDFKTQKKIKLRWLASDINSKLLDTAGFLSLMYREVRKFEIADTLENNRGDWKWFDITIIGGLE